MTAYGEPHADVYDELYAGRGKDYAAESDAVARIVRRYHRRARTLLDVGCGTGGHLVHLSRSFEVTGVEPSDAMRARAAARLPGVPLIAADAESLSLSRAHDAVVCLFSTIGYVTSLPAAVKRMAAHLTPGGVLVVEPWLYPEEYKRLHVGSDYTRTGWRTVYRMSHSGVDPAAPHVSVLTMHYLVGSPSGIMHWTEVHRMTMFTRAEFADAFAAADLTCDFVDPGFGRGLVVGLRS